MLRFATHFERAVHRNVHRFPRPWLLRMPTYPLPDHFRRVLGLFLRNGGASYTGTRLSKAPQSRLGMPTCLRTSSGAKDCGIGTSPVQSVKVKLMATDTITIQVDSEAARAFNAAPPADQRKMGALLSLWLKDVTMAEPAALKQLMTDLSKKARDRGLTPEILENLLKDA